MEIPPTAKGDNTKELGQSEATGYPLLLPNEGGLKLA
jgi:hypothetical protein